ncbi:MAG: hypothetical protein CMM94_08605 [Rickettsiales bacterium]|nr:hypothetical protein [Rickettsiales bacterium]
MQYMKMLTWNTAVAVCCSALLPFMAQASQKPVEIASLIQSERPLGSSGKDILWFDLYDIALWTDREHWSYDAPFALTFDVQKSFGKDSLMERVIANISYQRELPKWEEQWYRDTLSPILTDITQGDEISIVYKAEEKAEIYKNAKLQGRLSDPQLIKDLFNIWLSAETLEQDIRRDLLSRKPD